MGEPADDFERLDAWGTAEEPLTGCYCTRFPNGAPWENFAGTLATAQLVARVPDLNVRLAELLIELKVPAALMPAVLALATQDYIDEAPATHQDDWPALVAQARTLTRERVEDYVASLAAGGLLRPESAAVRQRPQRQH